MREIKFKYVMKAGNRIKISKPFALEQMDDISCMFEEGE